MKPDSDSGDNLLSIIQHTNEDTTTDHSVAAASLVTSTEVLHSCNDLSKSQRQGTITSARFNVIATMVGGGILSLPLAFHQAGNGLIAPLLLIGIGALMEYSIYFLVQASNHSQLGKANRANKNTKGTVSYESVVTEAFGSRCRYLSMVLIFAICFGVISANGIILRDMLLPLSDYLSAHNGSNGEGGSSPTLAQNSAMLIVVLLITPLCTLRSLTGLQNIGALSMVSISTLVLCITYRSAQCNFSSEYDDMRHMHWWKYISFLPSHDDTSSSSVTAAIHQLMNSLPIFIGGFMCHFNVLPVHNELQDPSPKRVHRVFSASIWCAAILYLFLGFVGSMYGNCTKSGKIDGNVLLSFPEDDTLLMLGRGCLSLTIAFALPLFVAPAKDVVLRALEIYCDWRERRLSMKKEEDGDAIIEVGGRGDGEYGLGSSNLIFTNSTDDNPEYEHVNILELENSDVCTHDLTEPLLDMEIDEANTLESRSKDDESNGLWKHTIISITILWMASALACCINSIDTMIIIGGSVAILICFIIPSSAYLLLVRRKEPENEDEIDDDVMNDEDAHYMTSFTNMTAWMFIIVFTPIMFICGGNAIYVIIYSN